MRGQTIDHVMIPKLEIQKTKENKEIFGKDRKTYEGEELGLGVSG